MKKPGQLALEHGEASVAATVVAATGSPAMSIDGDRFAAVRIARAIGASALLVVGGVHLEQYTVAHFSVIPTIGPLFLVNFIAATSLGLVLLVPIRRCVGRRRLLFDSIVALAGIGVAVGALTALLISEQKPLFGFMEHGYRLEIVIAIAAEAIAILSLGVFLAMADRRAKEPGEKVLARDEGGKGTSRPTATEA
jgi:hypothetical protein